LCDGSGGGGGDGCLWGLFAVNKPAGIRLVPVEVPEKKRVTVVNGDALIQNTKNTI